MVCINLPGLQELGYDADNSDLSPEVPSRIVLTQRTSSRIPALFGCAVAVVSVPYYLCGILLEMLTVP